MKFKQVKQENMNNRFISIIFLLALCCFCSMQAQEHVFKVENPDYKRSPYTGMTREHWKQAARYLLEGAFRHVKDLETPMYFERMGNVCYPRDSRRVRGATFEGMCRTLFLAAPLLREDSTLTVNGIPVKDYYRRQLTMLVEPDSKQFLRHRGEGSTMQDLCEIGGLSASLLICGDVLFDPLPHATRDSLYSMMESYADGPTIPQNWRFFNVLAMSFFKTRGYDVNEKLMNEYLEGALSDYRGDGWYLDDAAYDYYSMWAYQLYGRVWARYYGEKYMPQTAAAFESRYEEMFRSYPYLFARNGYMPMYGRSCLYRFAAVSPLAWSKSDDCNYGWMRRIASGCLLQFLQHPDFLAADGVPTPGFYGAFDPVLQPYSCRGSVYWLGKAFLTLALDEDESRFWTDTENEGDWSKMKKGQVYNRWNEEAQLLITNYPDINSSEVRAVTYIEGKWYTTESYNRLAYSPTFPWQADGKNGEVAMAYIYRNAKNQWEPMRHYTCEGFDKGMLTRRAHPIKKRDFELLLKETPLPNGTLRRDQVTKVDSPTSLRLGHYALPERPGTRIQERIVNLKNGLKAYTIYNGEHELAFIALEGWEKVEFVRATGLHPDTKESVTINAETAVSAPCSTGSLLLFKEGTFKTSELNKAVKAACSSDSRIKQ